MSASPTTPVDLTSLTLGEVATIEDLSGIALSDLEGKPQGKFLAALVMVIKRRTGDPTFTFNQALAMPMDEAQQLLGLDQAEPAASSDEGKDAGAPMSAPAKKRSSSSR